MIPRLSNVSVRGLRRGAIASSRSAAAPVTVSVTPSSGTKSWGDPNLSTQIRTTSTLTFSKLTFVKQSIGGASGGYVGIASAKPTGTVAWIGKALLGVPDEAAGSHIVTLDAPVTMTSGVNYYLVFLACASQIRYISAAEGIVMTGLAKDSSEDMLYGTNFGTVFTDTGYPQIALTT